jgi:hypothetical protein
MNKIAAELTISDMTVTMLDRILICLYIKPVIVTMNSKIRLFYRDGEIKYNEIIVIRAL